MAEICPRGYKEGVQPVVIDAAITQLLRESDARRGFVWDSAEPLGDGWLTRAYFTDRKAFKRHMKTPAWRNILQTSNANCNNYSHRLHMPKCKEKVGRAKCWTG